MSLVEYVAAIEGLASAKQIINRTTPEIEQLDESLSSEEQSFYFADGAVISRQSEVDSDDNEFNDQMCKEVWIRYQVKIHPSINTIHPAQKSFTNRCQQSFWIKMQRQQAEAF